MSCVALMNESSLGLIKGTYLGQEGCLTGYNNAGKPYPPQGIEMTWTGASWQPCERVMFEAGVDVNKFAAPVGTDCRILDGLGGYTDYNWTAQVGGGAWVGGNGTPFYATPPAFGQYIGQQILVPNPAVPRGLSRLEWTGTLWVPPDGELILSEFSIAGIASITGIASGTLTQVYQSAIIPDIFLRDGGELVLSASFGAYDPSATPANVLLGVSLSNSVPVSTDDQSYPVSLTTNAYPWVIGTDENYPRKMVRVGSTFVGRSGFSFGRAGTDRNARDRRRR